MGTKATRDEILSSLYEEIKADANLLREFNEVFPDGLPPEVIDYLTEPMPG